MNPTDAAATVLVFAGGEPLRPGTPVPPHGLVIAADSGVHEAQRRGLRVDLVVGDLDSVDPDDLAAVEAAGGRVERHPVDKDATDLELALEAAKRRGAAHVVVLGGGGGRLDHLLANLLLLGAARFADLQVEARLDRAHVRALCAEPGRPATVRVRGPVGSLISLLPVGGPAEGVRTEGLRFPLDHETLPTGTSRGVSNELCEPTASVTLQAGTLLVVQPEAWE